MNPNDLKSKRIVNDDPWAVLIALACLIIVATGISIIVICVLWRRYRNSRIIFEGSLNPMEYEIPDASTEKINQNQKSQEYEIQSLDMYVPSDDKEDLSESHGVKKEMQLMQSQLPDSHQMTFNGY
ncbi:unnamed protein product [Brachionus calyciflorus]|uniref:Uncharacterized protein n=1 Tax=Brachionus calyciflorus TaxID=104777 RepID=A0A813M410_9BILA|nr:unnamed protein product [Brachionus calyciflorus]